ncbi:MAG TPA: DoxX family protein [bacterium]|nr:DoxX family protein [bacterium]
MDIALVILRLVVGLLVAGHGAQKLFGWFGGYGLATTSKFLESIGFRPASAWALLGAAAEAVGGVLFAVGLFSPLGSIGIGAAMAIAITKVHWPKLWASNGGLEYPLVNLAVAVAVGIVGPGAYALDRVWGTSLPSVISQPFLGLVALGYLIGMVSSAATKRASAATRSPDARAR